MKARLDQIPRYKKFVSRTDKALEQILWNTQTDVSRLSSEAFERVRAVCAHRYVLIPETDLFGGEASRHFAALDAQIEAIFKELAIHIVARVMRMRKHAYLLARLAEFEAIARAVKHKGKPNIQDAIQKDDVDQAMTRLTDAGHRLDLRIQLSLSRIKRKVMDALELARINQEKAPEMLDRIEKAFPKKVAYKRPPRILKPLREADSDKPVKPSASSVQVNFMDGEEWSDFVQSYKDTELPESRFDKEKVTVGEGDREMYAWEIEQEITHDFVKGVRNAEGKAGEKGKAHGVEDFVWVAVLDERTDECCDWRHGLSTSEIEDKLSDEHDDDECQAIVPPAHFNCRCRLVAVAEVPEGEEIEDEVAEVDEWLESLREK